MMFRRSVDKNPKNGEEENPFLLSFSDLMASLLAIFILALVVMMIQLHKQKLKLEEDRKSIVSLEQHKKILNENERLRTLIEELKVGLKEIQAIQAKVTDTLDGVGSSREKQLANMLETIQQDLKKQGIEVLVAENGTVLRIPEKALSFELSKYRIQDRYNQAADAIGSSLLNALSKNENREILDTVFIEGHTDAVPNRQEMGNWGLSTYRAISLWLHWTDSPGRHAELKNLMSTVNEASHIERPLISTSGYADTRPADLTGRGNLQTIQTGNAADRRIDIRFTLVTTKKKDLSELKSLHELINSHVDGQLKKLDGIK
jgi:flagellar motor protein MotB